MSKIIESFTEVLIYPAANHKDAEAIRSMLVQNFSHCWFFLYTQTYQIYATNEYGGRLSDIQIKELKVAAVRYNASLYS